MRNRQKKALRVTRGQGEENPRSQDEVRKAVGRRNRDCCKHRGCRKGVCAGGSWNRITEAGSGRCGGEGMDRDTGDQ